MKYIILLVTCLCLTLVSCQQTQHSEILEESLEMSENDLICTEEQEAQEVDSPDSSRKERPAKKLVLKLEDPSVVIAEESISREILPSSAPNFSSSEDESHEGLDLAGYIERLKIGYLEDEDAALIGYSFARKSTPARVADARSEIATPLEWREELNR